MTLTSTETPEGGPKPIAEIINVAWSELIEETERRSDPHTRDYVYASSKRECLRRMVLDMTDGDKTEPFNTETLAKFRRGNDRERDLKNDLARCGRNSNPPFEVVGSQERFELKDKKGRVAIVGKVDCRLQFTRTSRVPVEIKSWSVYLTNRIFSFEDLFLSPWTKPGAYQLLAYLLGAGEPVGVLLLDKPGLPMPITVKLEENLELIEHFLQDAELAMDHKEAGTLPDYHQDPAECQRCPFFGGVCNPPLKHSGAEVILDEGFEAKLLRREELKGHGKEFAALDKEIKARVHGLENAVCGQFILEGAWRKKTIYDVPDVHKQAYEIIREANKRIEPKGSFVMEITKL